MESEKSFANNNHCLLIFNLLIIDIMRYFYCIEQVINNWIYHLNGDGQQRMHELINLTNSMIIDDTNLNIANIMEEGQLNDFPSDIDIDIDVDLEDLGEVFDDELQLEPEVPSSIIIPSDDESTTNSQLIEDLLRNHFESI